MGLGRYTEPTGLWSLLEESTGVVWNKIPMRLVPILMRDRACRIDASRATKSTAAAASSLLVGPGGPIGLVGPIGAVESNGVSTGVVLLFQCNRS